MSTMQSSRLPEAAFPKSVEPTTSLVGRQLEPFRPGIVMSRRRGATAGHGQCSWWRRIDPRHSLDVQQPRDPRLALSL
jgi:hypothetical protein